MLVNKGTKVDLEERTPSESYPISLRLAYLLTALCDFTGYIIRTIGLKHVFAMTISLSYCGSGLFQVAFSSVAIWSALYSRVILKRPINRIQWLGIGIVTLGLVLSPLSAQNSSSSPLTGILLTLLGAQFYALSYILNEYISVFFASSYHVDYSWKWRIEKHMQVDRHHQHRSLNCLHFSRHMYAHPISCNADPNRDTLIIQPLKLRQSSFSVLSLPPSDTDGVEGDRSLHSVAFRAFLGALFHPRRTRRCVDRSSPMRASMRCFRRFRLLVLQVGVPRDDEWSDDPNQCLTLSKGVATVLVCIGIVIFNKGKSQV